MRSAPSLTSDTAEAFDAIVRISPVIGRIDDLQRAISHAVELVSGRFNH